MAETEIQTAGRDSSSRRPDAIAADAAAFDTLRFGCRFVSLTLICYLAAGMLPAAVLEPVCRLTAETAAALIDLSGTQVIVAGTSITSGPFRADVIPECTPLFMVGLFCSFLLAAPGSLGRKSLGLLWGVPVLTLLNLIRIAIVVVAGANFPVLFEYVHVYLGQIAMILAVFALCLGWLRNVTAAPTVGDMPAFSLRFAVFSGLLFLCWLRLNKWYVLGGDYLVRAFFELFGYRLAINYRHEIYYHTFNLIGFAAVMLASPSLAPGKRLKGISLGLLILFISHLQIRICDVLFATFGLESADKLSLLLNVSGDFMLPVLVWLLMAGKKEAVGSSSGDVALSPSPAAVAPRPFRHL